MGGVNFRIPIWERWGRPFARTGARPALDRRRALRLPVRMPVLIYGWLGSEPFSENSETINVSILSGLVPVAAPVTRWQKLILTNLQTNEEVACRVARLVKIKHGRTLAGLEFLQLPARFWRTGPLPAPSGSR